MCGFSECKSIKILFKKEVDEAILKSEQNWKKMNTQKDEVYPGISKWEITDAITSAIKVEQSFDYEKAINQKFIQYNVNYQYGSPYPLDIAP